MPVALQAAADSVVARDACQDRDPVNPLTLSACCTDSGDGQAGAVRCARRLSGEA
jgi:hypothetical protein